MSTRSRYVGGAVTFYDPGKSYLYTRRESRYAFHDDFDTGTTFPATGSRANGNPWVKKITGAAPPTFDYVADGSGGLVQATLTATSEAQDATGYWDDSRNMDLDRAVIFQAYARLTVLPTGLAIGHLGLASDYAAGFIGTTYNAGFTLGLAGAVSANMDDNVTPLAVSTGVTMVVNTWYSFRVEALSKSAIRYYINGVAVATTTTFNYGGSAGANSVLQPFIGIGKASGTGVGTLQVDSVDVWQN